MFPSDLDDKVSTMLFEKIDNPILIFKLYPCHAAKATCKLGFGNSGNRVLDAIFGVCGPGF